MSCPRFRKHSCDGGVPPADAGGIHRQHIPMSTSISSNATAGRVIRAIGEGVADIGIIAEAVDPAEELETLPFAEDRLVLITPRQRHALIQRAPRKSPFSRNPGPRLRQFSRMGTTLQRDPGSSCGSRGPPAPSCVSVSPASTPSRGWSRAASVLPSCRNPQLDDTSSQWPSTLPRLPMVGAPRHFTICMRSFASLPPPGQMARRIFESPFEPRSRLKTQPVPASGTQADIGWQALWAEFAVSHLATPS